MQRLLFGAGLLAATIVTGYFAGSTSEPKVRSVTHTVTEERVVYRDSNVPASGASDEGVAPAQAEPGELPEDLGVVDRVRHPFPDLADWQAEEIAKYHRDYKKRLHAHGMGIAAVLMADHESQRQAVERMRELRRKRNEFMRDLLGREKWERWKEIERTGGRNVDELFAELQKRK